MARISKRLLQSGELFQGPAFAAGGASERGIIAKRANGCRGVLVFRIAQKQCVLRGFRARRGVDFHNTSKRLQSGALLEDTAAFAPR